jgi:hypothetical protein
VHQTVEHGVDLAEVGDYPSAPRLVAVANGSGARATQGFNARDQIVEWEYSSLFLSVIGNVSAVPDASRQTIFHGFVHVIFTSPEKRVVTVSGTS